MNYLHSIYIIHSNFELTGGPLWGRPVEQLVRL